MKLVKAGLYVCMLLVAASAARASSFVVNGDFSAGNTGFSSSATYVASGSLSYNQYAVRTSASTANGSWCGQDHTSGSGNMLLVDSAVGPVWSQTIVLSPGNYAFSVWIMNVLCPQNNPLPQPVLELRVGGATLAGPMSIPQVSGTWLNMSCSFSIATAGPVTFEVWSSQGAVNGADFALDDIVVDGVVGTSESTWGRVKALYR